MSEYIEREALMRNLKQFAPEQLTPLIESLIQKQPAADVVEVVRCKDCAIPHNRFTGCPKLNGLIPPENHFCSFGERMDSENGVCNIRLLGHYNQEAEHPQSRQIQHPQSEELELRCERGKERFRFQD